jgi:hypothetical protein
MIWGETGTRNGATKLQVASIGWLWSRYDIKELRDGDCVGTDAQLYHLARAMDLRVTIHPPVKDTFRAFCGSYDTKTTVLPERGYFIRDRDLVDASEVVVACPKQVLELGKMSGGTWYTINYTRQVKKPLAIVWLNGHISYERWDGMRKL